MVAKVGSNTFHPVRAVTSAHNDIQIPRTILRLRPATAIVAAGQRPVVGNQKLRGGA